MKEGGTEEIKSFILEYQLEWNLHITCVLIKTHVH